MGVNDGVRVGSSVGVDWIGVTVDSSVSVGRFVGEGVGDGLNPTSASVTTGGLTDPHAVRMIPTKVTNNR